MNLPSLPTDNLYKFCAISGLVLMLFGLTYPVQKIFELQLKVADTETETNVMQKRTEHLQADTDFLERRNDTTLQQTQELQRKSREAEIETARLSGTTDKLELLLNQMWFMLFVSGASALAGLKLAIFGFLRWYTLVQMPADAIVAAQTPKQDT